MKNISKKFLILIILFVIALPVAYAINTISQGFRNTPGLTQTIDVFGVCKKVVNGTTNRTYFIPTKTSQEWQTFRNNVPQGVNLNDCIVNILLSINSNTANYNIANAAGNPSVPINVVLTINATVYSTNTGTAALSTGSFPNGSTVTIINNGSIIGAGGAGGIGTTGLTLGAAVQQSAQLPAILNGKNGGDALSLQFPIIINNINGNILAGGGGGGAGGAIPWGLGGGAGGGGAGYIGGAGGVSGPSYFIYSFGLCGSCLGNPGNMGGINGGLGGAGVYSNGYGTYSGKGGNGGGYGQVGQQGVDTNTILPEFGLGGAPGNAVRRNGFTASITGGTVLGPIN